MTDQTIRNEYDEVVMISHAPRIVESAALAGAPTPTQLANLYISQNKAELGLTESRMESEFAPELGVAQGDEPVIVTAGEKNIAGSTVVVYDQTVAGLPIFNARMGVHVDSLKMAVTSVQSSMHGHVEISNPEQQSNEEVGDLTKTKLKKILGITLPNMQKGRISRQVVYRFEPEMRVETEEHEHEDGFGDVPEQPPLQLADLPEGIEKGKHYIVNEVLFRASRYEHEAPVHWRALVEPGTGTVLFIRALIASATGMIFQKDPQTQSGSTASGSTSDAVLNTFRTSVPLPGLTVETPQPLSGEYVELMDFDVPVAPPPEIADPLGAFTFNVRSDEFSAVNAYFHCDNLFRTMVDLGFDVPTYFNRTSFPVPVDHRARVSTSHGNERNASAPGNEHGNGLGELRFALLQVGQPVGIATSNRVVWHEFGHALLWEHVNFPNFGFAHSAGDSLAAILNDPGSNAVDRFHTFPWVGLGRRHDRAVANGWAWFGPNYGTSYDGEQVLSTTLFRLYRSIGGDSNSLATQIRASETVVYLIFKAIGLLTSMSIFPEVFVTNLQNADNTTSNLKGIPGGALHKVIRWAFEKQGLFQPDARPFAGNTVMSEGDPPETDIYIDDGRGGEYQYLENHWSCQDMWVRRAADGGTIHQLPLVGRTNFMYVRVKNRGQLTLPADMVHVEAFHCNPGTGLAFPDDWAPMDTPSLPATANLPPGGETIVGPFSFVPTKVGHECLLAIAQAPFDPGIDQTINGTIPENRFVPFDNNIAQRNVSPVFPSFKHLVDFFAEHPLWIRNPLKEPVVCRIEIEVPGFLRQLGWTFKVLSAGGTKFELGPRDLREVVFSIDPGQEFSRDKAIQAIAEGDHTITIRTFLNDELSGGMSYPLSFEAQDEGDIGLQGKENDRSVVEASDQMTLREILNVLGTEGSATGQSILGRRIKRIRLELDLDDSE